MEKLGSNYENMEQSLEATDGIDENLVALEDEVFCNKSSKYKALCDKENELKSRINDETLKLYLRWSSKYGKALRNQIDYNLDGNIIPGGESFIKLKWGDYLPGREGVLRGVRASFKGIIKKEIKEMGKSLKNPEELRELMDICFSKIILQYRIKFAEKGEDRTN